MKIGIISALKEEIETLLLDVCEEERLEIGGRTYISGTLYGREAVLVISDCGKVAAATAVTVLINRFRIDALLFTGVAGAADGDLSIGDIVVADALVQHDYDVSALTGFDEYGKTTRGGVVFPVSGDVTEALVRAAEAYVSAKLLNDLPDDVRYEFHIDTPAVIVGTIGTGDQFIANKNTIAELSMQIENLRCVEMETAAAAQVCAGYGIPLYAFRVISDRADEHANINFDSFVNSAATVLTKGVIKEWLENTIRKEENC